MKREKNHRLQSWMIDHGLSANELAEQVNKAVRAFSGQSGKATERTVFRWLSGENRWPQTRFRKALEQVTGLPVADLGFVPTSRRETSVAAALQEDPMRRRHFFTATTGTALALGATGPAAAASRPTVGLRDVEHLRTELSKLWQLDDQHGGSIALETRAAALAQRTLGLQRNGSAHQRIRSRLYALAAAFTAAAMWAAVDLRRMRDAQRYLDEAVKLAGLSGDGEVQHQTWRYAAMLATQRGDYTEAMAASEAAMSTHAHRTDPLYMSISHSRLALSAANAGEHTRARRALDRATTALDRADLNSARSASVAYYTRAELQGLTGIVHYRLGQPDHAEYHVHQCLAELREDQHRNRAYYTAQAALFQIAQGDLDQAVDTAATVIPPTDAASGRIHHLLGTFTSALNMKAPDARVTQDWNNRIRAARHP
ncbi:Tat pathway signal protein [Streptomyces sp. DH12]|uniref:Tat pathway signal protein n=1 Tax=Streptomyces sp. DH12 TaxID=2857010 RepID=UPI001E4CCF9B|nr:Tat pathway signal protein [Streptomyces sp. DH12]